MTYIGIGLLINYLILSAICFEKSRSVAWLCAEYKFYGWVMYISSIIMAYCVGTF